MLISREGDEGSERPKPCLFNLRLLRPLREKTCLSKKRDVESALASWAATIVFSPPSNPVARMTEEVLYKIDGEIAGPRPLEEVSREIRSGKLPSDTPVQLTSDRIWTDLEGLEKKRSRGDQFGFPHFTTICFLATNIVIAGVGCFWLGACLFGGGLLLSLGVLVDLLEKDRKEPLATVDFVTALTPLPNTHFSKTESTPVARWLIFSGLFQLMLFLIFLFTPSG